MRWNEEEFNHLLHLRLAWIIVSAGRFPQLINVPNSNEDSQNLLIFRMALAIAVSQFLFTIHADISVPLVSLFK